MHVHKPYNLLLFDFIVFEHLKHNSSMNPNIDIKDPELERLEATSIFQIDKPNLLHFLNSFLEIISINSKDEPEFSKNIKKLNFDQELQIDLESVEKGMPGKILNLNINITEEDKYMFLLNKALFFQSFQCQNQQIQEITFQVGLILKIEWLNLFCFVFQLKSHFF